MLPAFFISMEQLQPLFSSLKNIAEIGVNELMLMLSKDTEFVAKIIELNTISQLYDKGIDSKGDSLGEYSPATIEGTSSFLGKKQKGQRFDHITLKDSGDFYNSWRAYLDMNSDIQITASPFKTDDFGHTINLLTEFGEDILGLTDENLQILIELAKEKCINFIRIKLAA